MNKLKEKKNELRKEYKEKRLLLDPLYKENADRIICKRFIGLASYGYAKTILVYSPIKGEIDITDIIKDALSKGKRIAFPRCYSDNIMKFHYISDLSELTESKMGIPEPDENAPLYDNQSAQSDHPICLVPALVYDKEGYRLGYGGGYYDRFLSSFKGSKTGLIYSRFILSKVPRGNFDLAANVLVTEKGVIIPNAN